LEDLVRKLFLIFLVGSLGVVVGCSSGGGGQTPVGVPTGGGGGTSNTLAIAVDGGPNPTQNGLYENGVFASATICAPGSTSNCVTVDHLLVDTGSFGLRVLQSEVTSLNLPQIGGLFECVQFGDGSNIWGPVVNSSVTLAGETANNVPIHLIGTSAPGPGCTGNNENSQATLGANGILGVGLEPFDCGTACDVNSGSTSPPTPAYYTCPSSGCVPSFASCGSICGDTASLQQVTDPVVLFPVDNNGVIVELQSVSGSAATDTGSLIIGIGTESNNQLANANVYLTACDSIDTSFEGTSFSVDAANCTSGVNGGFFDTGSNALFFFDAANVLPVCAANASIPNITSFYCPASLMSLSAVNTDFNSPPFTQTADFSVDNAATLLTSGNAALSTLAGPQPMVSNGFDWGLPFFYGKSVYVAIDGATMPSSLPAGPWWAF
jgi:hypothetical protein